MHVFNLNVVYTMPNGDYVPFEGTAMSTSPSFNQFVFSSKPEYHKNNFYWSGSIDTKHYIAASTVNGLLHSHFVFNAFTKTQSSRGLSAASGALLLQVRRDPKRERRPHSR